MKDKGHKGCLMLIGTVSIFGIFLAVAYHVDFPLLKNACYLYPGLAASYVGSTYFTPAEKREKNRFSRKTWVLLLISYLVLAALLAWWLDGRLW